MNISTRITELRTKKNMSTNKLANLACISQSHMRGIELGEKCPTVDILERICNVLDIELSDFFDDSPQGAINPPLLREIGRMSENQQQALLEFILSLKK